MTERRTLVAIVDDDPDMISVARATIAANVPTVEVVEVDWALWDRWDRWPDVAVAVIDLRMPVPGLTILRELGDRYPELGLVAWSAWIGPAMGDELGAAAGKLADATIPKGDLERLVAVVSGMVNL